MGERDESNLKCAETWGPETWARNMGTVLLFRYLFHDIMDKKEMKVEARKEINKVIIG